MVSELSQRVGLNLLYDQYGMEVVAEHFGAQYPFSTLTLSLKGLRPQKCFNLKSIDVASTLTSCIKRK